MYSQIPDIYQSQNHRLEYTVIGAIIGAVIGVAVVWLYHEIKFVIQCIHSRRNQNEQRLG